MKTRSDSKKTESSKVLARSTRKLSRAQLALAVGGAEVINEPVGPMYFITSP